MPNESSDISQHSESSLKFDEAEKHYIFLDISADPITDYTKDDSKTQTKTKRIRRFKKEWIKIFPWLTCKRMKCFCKICNVELVNNVTHLNRHQNTSSHKLKESQLEFENYLNENETTQSSFCEEVQSSSSSHQFSEDDSESKQQFESNTSAINTFPEPEQNQRNCLINVEKYNINRSKSNALDQQGQGITYNSNCSVQEENECDLAGKRIAWHLKRMNEKQRLLAEKMCYEILYYGRMDQLEDSSKVTVAPLLNK